MTTFATIGETAWQLTASQTGFLEEAANRVQSAQIEMQRRIKLVFSEQLVSRKESAERWIGQLAEHDGRLVFQVREAESPANSQNS